MFEQKRPDLLNESRDRWGGLDVHTVNPVAGQSGNGRLNLLATPRRERSNEQVQSVCRVLHLHEVSGGGRGVRVEHQA
jgi:hypothetical protein